jgi:hypothetical protein
MTAMQSRSTRTSGRTPPTLGAVPQAPEHPASPGPVEPALARCGPDELAQAHRRRDVLLDRARVLVRIIAHDPDLADCADAGCALAGCPDGARCGLAHRLAGVEDACPTAAVIRDDPSLELATRRFEAALTDAVDAVRRCRQTEHGSGRCWFAAVPDVDGCGEVLRAAHRLG